MNTELEKMRSRILDIADPNNPYTQEDFDNEFKQEQSNAIDFRISLKFVNKSKNQDPAYATDGSSGFDLRANLDKPYTLEPKAFAAIPTGLYFEIPQHLEIQVRPRSGLAFNNGVTVLNSPGTVDADYRGEVKVILINHSDYKFVINDGDRIAQAVIASVIGKTIIKFQKVDEISTDTIRGSGGFGSTGIK